MGRNNSSRSHLYSPLRLRHNFPADRIHFPILKGFSWLESNSPRAKFSTASRRPRNSRGKQVASVIDALGDLAKKNVGKKGPGIFVLSGLLKIVAIQKPAVPAHKGINPFTKQEQMFKAKPARKVIKVRALKGIEGRREISV